MRSEKDEISKALSKYDSVGNRVSRKSPIIL